MRKILLLLLSILSQTISAQGLIGTPNRWVKVNSFPNSYYSLQVSGVISQIITKEIIRTPNSLIFVCNYPNNYFYIKVNGKDIKYTEKDGVFTIDNELIQIMASHKNKFLEDTSKILSNIEFVEKYVKWEISYIESSLSFDVKSKLEFLRSTNGKEVAFWTYEMPLLESETITDSSSILSTQKQIFVLTKVKEYVVGIYSPLLLESHFNRIRTYLLENIDGLVESDKFIDIEELNK